MTFFFLMAIFFRKLRICGTLVYKMFFHCDILLDLWKSCIQALTIWKQGKRQFDSLFRVSLFGCANLINPTVLWVQLYLVLCSPILLRINQITFFLYHCIHSVPWMEIKCKCFHCTIPLLIYHMFKQSNILENLVIS